MDAVTESIESLGIRRACGAVGLSRATYYRLEKSRRKATAAESQAPGDNTSGSDIIAPSTQSARRPCPVPGRALSDQEEKVVIDHLHSERFVDMAPAEVRATLLDEGKYLCSISTMYRILARHAEVKERRAQRRHPVYVKPELLATGPNQVWSWDITKLKGPEKWSYYYLYVIVDIFSRYVVGWMVADRDYAYIAKDLISHAVLSQEVPKDQLQIHADRGSSMKSKTVAELMADLGVIKSHSRPHTSNDNPYSESQFRTLKYRPEYPERFNNLEEARLVCKRILDWYNQDHYHSGIGFLTPQSVHFGKSDMILERRAAHLLAAHTAHPQRFVNKVPMPHALPASVYINRPEAAPSANGSDVPEQIGETKSQ